MEPYFPDMAFIAESSFYYSAIKRALRWKKLEWLQSEELELDSGDIPDFNLFAGQHKYLKTLTLHAWPLSTLSKGHSLLQYNKSIEAGLKDFNQLEKLQFQETNIDDETFSTFVQNIPTLTTIYLTGVKSLKRIAIPNNIEMLVLIDCGNDGVNGNGSGSNVKIDVAPRDRHGFGISPLHIIFGKVKSEAFEIVLRNHCSLFYSQLNLRPDKKAAFFGPQHSQ